LRQGYGISVGIEQIIETMGVLLEKETMRRIKIGEKQYS
jgi:hypothetical protein